MRDRLTGALLIAAAVLFFAGLFVSLLLLPALGAALMAVTTRRQEWPTALRSAAWLFTILAAIGFATLGFYWGKLEYGLLGYLILWGPLVSAACAIALFIASVRAAGPARSLNVQNRE